MLRKLKATYCGTVVCHTFKVQEPISTVPLCKDHFLQRGYVHVQGLICDPRQLLVFLWGFRV